MLGGTPTVSTYHSYAGRLVREHALRLGIEPESRLLSEAAAWQYAAEVVDRYDGADGRRRLRRVDRHRRGRSTWPARWPSTCSSPDDVERYLDEFEAAMRALPKGASRASDLPEGGQGDPDRRCAPGARCCRMVRAYLDLKRSRDAMDFADQMALAARLARSFPDIGAIERHRFRAVLLDEFQDTSAGPAGAAARAVRRRRGRRSPVTAVGDPQPVDLRLAGRERDHADPRSRASSPTSAATAPTCCRCRPAGATTTRSSRWPTTSPVRCGWSRRSPCDAAARPGAGPGRVQAARLLTAEDEAAHVADWIARALADGRGRAPTPRPRCCAASGRSSPR